VIYLDNAATTPLSPEVREAIEPFLGGSFGNPSSRHPLGIEAARAVERARERIALVLGAPDPDGVVFTSGGTEANNLGVLGAARARRRHGKHVLVGAAEHPSVRMPVQTLGQEGYTCETLRLAPGGALDLQDAARALRPDTCLVTHMAVNNEFGSRYPIEELSALVRGHSPHAHVHVDLIQALGKVPVSFAELGADSISISAHKLHGLKGTGALVMHPDTRLAPLVFGGGQERDVRPGTENVIGIVALGAAVEQAVRKLETSHAHMHALQRLLAGEIANLEGYELLEARGGGRDGFSPAIAALLLPGPPAEVWMHHLEEKGVYTSVGSACNARSKEASPGLFALGLDERSARQVLRLSFAGTTSEDEVRDAVAALRRVGQELGVAAS